MKIRLNGHERKQLAETIKADINAYCQRAYDNKPRSHLGVSEIGEDCERRLVYSFRWMHREQFDGRMLRLFDRGHKEENRFVEWLKGIEAKVSEVTNQGTQWRMSGANGHYGGSLDGQMMLPERYGILNTVFLLEMKTHNAKSFAKLVSDGVKQSKPKHYRQMCGYGTAYEIDYGIYMAICKDNDDLHIEIVELDHTLGRQLETKANRVISSTQLPNKIAASAAYMACKFCPMSGICHNNEPVDVNCRSCAYSVPIDNARWYCNRWMAEIPKDAIPLACGEWQAFA